MKSATSCCWLLDPAYSRSFCNAFSSFFSGEDAGGAGKILSYADVCPACCVEERLYGGQTGVAEFKDEDAAGLEMRGGLSDETGVKFVAFFAAVESDFWFVIADFAHQRRCFAPADVRRIAHDEIEGMWSVFRDRCPVKSGVRAFWS